MCAHCERQARSRSRVVYQREIRKSKRLGVFKKSLELLLVTFLFLGVGGGKSLGGSEKFC